MVVCAGRNAARTEAESGTVPWFLSENAGCTLVLSGECGLYFGSCLEKVQAVTCYSSEECGCYCRGNAGCDLAHVLEGTGCLVKTVVIWYSLGKVGCN